MKNAFAFLLLTASCALVRAVPLEKRQAENLQPFIGAIGGKTAPPVTKDNSNRPFKVDNNGFLTLENAIQRSCDIQVNQCQDFFNGLPNANKQGIQAGDCNAQGVKCKAGDNGGSAANGNANANQAAGADAANANAGAVADQAANATGNAAGGGDGNVALAGPPPQNSDTEGADLNTNAVASNQDKADVQANAVADSGVTPPVSKGGVGGIDPATGETLMPLPDVSQFCKDSGQTAGDGTQLQTGYCQSVIQGQVPATRNMVSTIILQPANGATVDRNKDFDCVIQIANMQTGFFTVAASEYLTQPQTLNQQGQIKGHSHITIQQLTSLTQAPSAKDKAFFKGLNDKAVGNGQLSVTVPAGSLPAAGTYRICTMAGGFSHQPVVMPIAQRGAQDDCIRVTAA